MTTWYNLAPQPNWQEWLGVTISCNPSEFIFAADYLTNTIAVSSGSNYFTGKAVMVNSIGGVLPAPLSASAVYYIIFVGSSSFKLATTYADAIADSPLVLTDNGTGTLTIISTGQVSLQPNSNGYMNTYSSLNHATNKATYTDWTGNTQNPNPIIFDDKGMAVIYWAVNSEIPDDNYYIEIYTPSGVLLYSRDNFNAPPGIASGDTIESVQPNLLLNNEFDFWGMYDYGINSVSPVIATCTTISGNTETAYYWFFSKSNNNATDVLTRTLFSAGQEDVPNTPIYYMNIACTNAGAGAETFKNLNQQLHGVQTCAGQTLTLSFWANSTVNGTALSTLYSQYFGSGGSTTVDTPGADFSLTTTWTLYTVTTEVPGIGGKSVGAGSTLGIVFVLPLNSTYSINLANVQLTISETVQPYRQLSQDERFTLLEASRQAFTGDIMVQSFASNHTTWIPFESGTVGNGLSNATLLAAPTSTSLFAALWNTYSDGICPVYDKTGAKVARGASSVIDYAADYQIQVFFNSGRVISNTGAPDLKLVFSAQATPTNTITVSADEAYAAYTLFSGMAVQVQTTGTLPGGLAVSTNYFIITTTQPNSILPVPPGQVYQLATTHDRATGANGTTITPITLTTTGTGIQTLIISAVTTTPQLITQVAGQATGANSEGMTFTTGVLQLQGGGNQIGVTSPKYGNNPVWSSTQPTLALPHIIKL